MSNDGPELGSELEKRGEDLARGIPRLELPDGRAEEIREAMRKRLSPQTPAHPATDWRTARRRWLLAASLVLLILGSWWGLRGPRVRLAVASGSAGTLELLAVSAHASLRRDAAELDLVSGEPGEVRAWLKSLALSADLAAERPAEDARRFELLGATRLPVVYPAAAVSYRIDGRPVTLAVTAASRAPEAPNWSLLGKNVRTSVDPISGAHVLTWRNAGKAYTLVSELPSGGLEACLICHTDSERRNLVAKLQSEL